MPMGKWNLKRIRSHSIYISDRIVENIRKDSSAFSLARFADTLIKEKWYYVEEFWNV